MPDRDRPNGFLIIRIRQQHLVCYSICRAVTACTDKFLKQLIDYIANCIVIMVFLGHGRERSLPSAGVHLSQPPALSCVSRLPFDRLSLPYLIQAVFLTVIASSYSRLG